jgi:hypothetical protein
MQSIINSSLPSSPVVAMVINAWRLSSDDVPDCLTPATTEFLRHQAGTEHKVKFVTLVRIDLRHVDGAFFCDAQNLRHRRRSAHIALLAELPLPACIVAPLLGQTHTQRPASWETKCRSVSRNIGPYNVHSPSVHHDAGLSTHKLHGRSINAQPVTQGLDPRITLTGIGRHDDGLRNEDLLGTPTRRASWTRTTPSPTPTRISLKLPKTPKNIPCANLGSKGLSSRPADVSALHNTILPNS